MHKSRRYSDLLYCFVILRTHLIVLFVLMHLYIHCGVFCAFILSNNITVKYDIGTEINLMPSSVPKLLHVASNAAFPPYGYTSECQRSIVFSVVG